MKVFAWAIKQSLEKRKFEGKGKFSIHKPITQRPSPLTFVNFFLCIAFVYLCFVCFYIVLWGTAFNNISILFRILCKHFHSQRLYFVKSKKRLAVSHVLCIPLRKKEKKLLRKVKSPRL